MKERNIEIDILKGLAIVLVVIGHSIVRLYDPDSYSGNYVFMFCYSFHMPLFMFISGWLGGLKSPELIGTKWLFNRFCRLMIPYFIWNAIIIIRHQNFSAIDILSQLFITTPIWFLINLFYFDFSVFLANVFKPKKEKFSIIIMIVFYLTISLVYTITDAEPLKYTVLFYPYYFSGYWLVRKHKSISQKLKKTFIIVCALAYPISMLIYVYGAEKAAEKATIITEMIHIPAICGMLKLVLLLNSRYVIGFLGICFAYVIVHQINKYNDKLLKIFSFIGIYTMQTYLLHEYFFIYSDSFDKYLITVVSILLGVFLSVLIGLFVSRIKPLSRILFGA